MCEKCEEAQTKIEELTTLVVNISTSMDSLIQSVNSIGQQNTWMAEAFSEVFDGFMKMREQLSSGGLMGLLRGGVGVTSE